MRLDEEEARARFEASPVLRLATATAKAMPHVVPCTFAIDQAGRVCIGIDHKPKTTTDLKRLRNIAENPRVSMVVDHYDEDWTRLWWARADGTAVVDTAPWEPLKAKYPQYVGEEGRVIVVTVERWTGWSYT